MIYNRQGWVLLSMLFVELFIAPRKNVKNREISGGISTGSMSLLQKSGESAKIGELITKHDHDS
jgi:hypothetical protein